MVSALTLTIMGVQLAHPILPGVREQALDWQTAPPVHVLSYLVLGSEKDAKAGEVCECMRCVFFAALIVPP